jgi:hypothetical protein
MTRIAILYPMFALALLTIIVLSCIPFARFGAAKRGEVNKGDFRYGESPRVPGKVSLPNRNLMNLLELPVLFYVVCIVLYATDTVSAAAVGLAWSFVAARVLHSVIHLTYNNVMHRLAAFTASNFVLVALWIVAGIAIS